MYYVFNLYVKVPEGKYVGDYRKELRPLVNALRSFCMRNTLTCKSLIKKVNKVKYEYIALSGLMCIEGCSTYILQKILDRSQKMSFGFSRIFVKTMDCILDYHNRKNSFSGIYSGFLDCCIQVEKITENNYFDNYTVGRLMDLFNPSRQWEETISSYLDDTD